MAYIYRLPDHIPIPFDRARYSREWLAETRLRLYHAERARLEHKSKVAADAARPGSDRGPDGYAADKDEGGSEQPNW